MNKFMRGQALFTGHMPS